MTSDRDSILKSWLRTLRFSIEYYEDAFESGNNCRRENNRAARNMTSNNDEREDEQYVNIWDCALVPNSVDTSAKITDLDLDLDYVEVKKPRKKPVATPRASKTSEMKERIYENLPLTSTPEPIYANLPLVRASTPLYENLPLRGSIDSLKLEEEVFQTIQYLENVIGVASAYSEEDLEDLEEAVNDKEFTDSSSSFGEYYSPSLVSLHQRYAKENRVSALLEESEPCPGPESKPIPKIRSRSMAGDRRKRLSVPLRFTSDPAGVKRTHSFDENVCNFCHNRTKQISLSFATESTLSEEFLNEEAEELEAALGDNLLLRDEERVIETLKEDSVCWMAQLMFECEGEVDVLEEKELLKSFSDSSKGQSARPPPYSKFPTDVDNVEYRGRPDIQRNRLSKTTDFDAGRRKPSGTSHLKNFEVRGLIKMDLPNAKTVIFNVKDDHLIYENECLFRLNSRKQKREALCSNVIIKSVRYQKTKESTAVELKDTKNSTYILKFEKLDYAKKFMDNERVQIYITDNKVGLMHSLRKLLGKRASQAYLEKKGIYKPEPFFGNTLKDIMNSTNLPVPSFVTETIQLLERPENIKSLGLYRTSGNLATIQKIRLEVDKKNLNILNEYAKDPDVLTGSLKLFFRELKEPLITHEVCDKLLQCTRSNLEEFSSKDHQKIKSILVNSLHEANLETFAMLMKHLLVVIKYKEHNKMDSYNLAVCWGPSMVFDVTTADSNPTIESCRDIVCLSQSATRMVDFFLTYYEQYPAELVSLGKRTRLESLSEKMNSLRRQESELSIDSSRSSQQQSGSNLSLSIDEVIKSLVDYIEPHVHLDQLYRKPGSADKTNKIVKKLNKKKIKEVEKYKNDVHELADALKKYLKDHDSLISDEIVESVLRISSDNGENYLKPAVKHLVLSKIEESPKKDTLMYLLRHLSNVVKCQEDSKEELLNSWVVTLHKPKKNKVSPDKFIQFLSVAVKAFNDDLPDVVRSSFGTTKGNSPVKNTSMDELLKEIKYHQNEQAEKGRNSRYDNVDSDDNLGDVGEASILDEDDKTEQTKL